MGSCLMSTYTKHHVIYLYYSSASSSVEVPVFYLSHPADRVLTLGCPGAHPNMAVAWDQGTKPIYRDEHLAGRKLSTTPPRLMIDTGHHLVFTPAKTQDSGRLHTVHFNGTTPECVSQCFVYFTDKLQIQVNLVMHLSALIPRSSTTWRAPLPVFILKCYRQHI